MFVAWRDLRFARGRFALMGVVIVLITLLVVLLSGLTAGLGRQNTSAVVDLPADHLVFAAPSEGDTVSFSDSVLDAATWDAWARVPGVERAEPLLIATTRAEIDERSVAVTVFGVEPGSALVDAPITDGTVVLSAGAVDALRAGTGDTLTVAGQQLTVTTRTADDWYSHTPVVWLSLAEAQGLIYFGPAPATAGGIATTPRATVVALTTSGLSASALAGADTTLGTTTLARSATLDAIGSYAAENGSLQLMRGFLFAISALVIGAFFTVWTIQRSGDVAVLKALGASTGYLLRDALGQAVVLLVLGTGVGAGIAAGLGAAVRGTVPFVLDPATVVLPTAVMVLLGAAGAGLSVRRITSVDPLTALGSAR